VTRANRYNDAREAFEYLELIAPLDDQVELDASRLPLMQNPTKAEAAAVYETGIDLWFSEHGRSHDDLRVDEIAERYLIGGAK
jgi:hypothetical protein